MRHFLLANFAPAASILAGQVLLSPNAQAEEPAAPRAEADAVSDPCEPEFVEQDGILLVLSPCTLEGEIERPQVEFVLQPTSVEFGPLPAYSPIDALEQD